MESILALLATIAGVAMSFSYFFQFLKIMKTKSVKDISLTTFLILFVGIIIWFIYGLSMMSYPLIFAYGTGLIGSALVLVAYFMYRT